jgi:hypothetical protein
MNFWRRRQPVGDRQQAAEATILRAQQEVRHFRNYLDLVAETASMLRRYGLGQTLAYLQMRGSGHPDSPYSFIYQHLQEHLHRSPGFSGKDLLAYLTQENSTTYLRLSREALAFSEVWVRAARAAQKDTQKGGKASSAPVQQPEGESPQ